MDLECRSMRLRKPSRNNSGLLNRGGSSSKKKHVSSSSVCVSALALAGESNASEGEGLGSCGAGYGVSRHRKCVCVSSTCEIVEFPQIWNEFRTNEQLCDGVIHCGDGKDFKIHRVILSAVSPYFKALFTNSLNGGAPEADEVRLLEANGATLRSILDFAYTGQCAINSKNVERVLALADQLGVLGVVQQCCQYLLQELKPENCLGIFRFAQQYFCQDLEQRGRRYILHHFRKILHSSAEFGDLTFEELCSILCDDELNVRREELVFEAARRWVDRDPVLRAKHMPDLLGCVRFGLTPQSFLDNTVLNCPHLIEDQALQRTLGALLTPRETLQVQDHPGQDAAVAGVDSKHPLARPRIPYEILFAVGGWSAGSPTNFIETYDCRANQWLLSTNTDVQPRAYHGLVELDGLIYMIGGFDGNEHFNTVRCFNPATREWREQACMYQARCYVSVCTLGGQIYALGGYNGRNRMESAETYEPKSNQWKLIPSMNKARSDASAASLNGKVYIVGGFNGQEVLSSAEVFDPGTSQWSLISCMHSARSGVSLVAHQGCLYALGGFNGTKRLNSGERLDPTTGSEWQEIPNMFYPRSNFATVILDDLIFVIGGFNGSTTVAYTECLDVDSSQWYDAAPMNLNRSALSAVVLAGLPTAREYSYLYKTHSVAQDHCAEGS